jgi:integrating conjugative element relaxase (TIGR03760 family)
MAPLASTLWLGAAAFIAGVLTVAAIQWRNRRRLSANISAGAAASPSALSSRPATQLPVRSFEQLVQETGTANLLTSIDGKMRLSADSFNNDCMPVLRALAEYVQMLPASEAHHHAQPGGLWIHMLEVIDAALTYRAGMELPKGSPSEERLRVRHRWTYGVFLAGALHDIGKPIADMKVTVFDRDPFHGQPWAALAGPMRSSHYSVAFTSGNQKSYALHQKLPAILMQKFVPESTVRWLSEAPGLVEELLAYLSHESKDGALGEIVKKADGESVRRNLLNGPRVRFASARVTPLIERLMSALRRMLKQGGVLPLNKAGASGWVYQDSVWFVCGRLADEIRAYLSANESLEGIPGPDKNDRIFDEFQDFGAVVLNPDTKGAVWRVNVQCDGWSSPGVLTVLRFPLDRLYESAQDYPPNMHGAIAPVVKPQAAGTASSTLPASPSSDQLIPTPQAKPSTASSGSGVPPTQSAAPASKQSPQPAPAIQSTQTDSTASPALSAATTPAAPTATTSNHTAGPEDIPTDVLARQDQDGNALREQTWPEPTSERSPTAPAAPIVASHGQTPPPVACPAPIAPEQTRYDQEEHLPADDQASLQAIQGLQQSGPPHPNGPVALEIQAPLAPFTKPKKGNPSPKKDAAPVAKIFVAWLAQAVSTGQIKYNEQGGLVHFVPEGALLFSPEIFKRFIADYQHGGIGPIAELITSHGEQAFSKVQNQLAKSPWAVRNGDENLHYYAFTKHNGTLSSTSSYFLLGQPELFWRPVPPPNPRIVKSARPPKRQLPGSTGVGKSSTPPP